MGSREPLQPSDRPVWSSFAGRFSDPRQCLAAYLALETAEVLSHVKPANLLNIPNRPRACGKNLYQLWRQHGEDLVGRGGLAVLELVDRRDSLLLLIYDPQALAALLARKKVATILGKAGYRQPTDMAASLSHLKSRLLPDSFPHEIGVFLGYPLKDVVGFMGWARIPFTCQGPLEDLWQSRRKPGAGGCLPAVPAEHGPAAGQVHKSTGLPA